MAFQNLLKVDTTLHASLEKPICKYLVFYTSVVTLLVDAVIELPAVHIAVKTSIWHFVSYNNHGSESLRAWHVAHRFCALLWVSCALAGGCKIVFWTSTGSFALRRLISAFHGVRHFAHFKVLFWFVGSLEIAKNWHTTCWMTQEAAVSIVCVVQICFWLWHALLCSRCAACPEKYVLLFGGQINNFSNVTNRSCFLHDFLHHTRLFPASFRKSLTRFQHFRGRFWKNIVFARRRSRA